MAYTKEEIRNINIRNLSTLNTKYYDEEGNVYIGVENGRLKQLPKAITTTFKPTNEINEKTVQEGDSSLMIFPLQQILESITEYFTIQPGDLIYTGTPVGVGPTAKGDVFEGFFEGKSVFKVHVNP